MYKNKKILAVITARGGSKGIPGKNIKPLAKRPLIYWTIMAARKSRYIDSLIVSTDSPKIAAVSEKYGSEVPFLRPARLATDTATSLDVLTHAVGYLKKKGADFDAVVLLQPTSPLRRAEDIDKAVELLFTKKAGAVVSVSEAPVSPLWMNTLPADGCMKDFLKRTSDRNRQELPVYYQLNGAVFAGFTDYIVKNKGFLGGRTFAYVMPKSRSVDIDDITDFRLAEALMRKR